jgi:hypothetical protein
MRPRRRPVTIGSTPKPDCSSFTCGPRPQTTSNRWSSGSDRGLETTVSQVRRDQASGWRFFRATATADAAVYVMLFDPVIRDADYDPVKMLVELAPGEAQPLYERLRGSVIRVERLDLNRVR